MIVGNLTELCYPLRIPDHQIFIVSQNKSFLVQNENQNLVLYKIESSQAEIDLSSDISDPIEDEKDDKIPPGMIYTNNFYFGTYAAAEFLGLFDFNKEFAYIETYDMGWNFLNLYLSDGITQCELESQFEDSDSDPRRDRFITGWKINDIWGNCTLYQSGWTYSEV